MGCGIAQVFAQAGYQVLLYDMQAEFVDAGVRRITKALDGLVQKGAITASDQERILGNVKPLHRLEPDPEIKLVVEAITENMDAKAAFFESLGELPEDAVIASNTSALSVTELAAKTQKPESFIGMHFFNPPATMKLVEIIKGMKTSGATLKRAKEYVKSLGKDGIEVEESPGFVVNRMLVPLINEAVFLLSEGVASAEDIDAAMKGGANHPLGPLALADLIGIDVCLSVMETLQAKFGDPKYRPCPLLGKMVAAGLLGRKTKQGFYVY